MKAQQLISLTSEPHAELADACLSSFCGLLSTTKFVASHDGGQVDDELEII
jgi:hypothetical protein